MWASRRTQDLVWEVPGGQAAPVVGATLNACRGKAKPECVVVRSSNAGGARVRLPRQGLFRGGVYLTDEAGNASAANVAPVAVGYDATKPRRPRLGGTARKGRTRSVRVRFKDKGAAPITRLAATLCRGNSTKRCRTLRPKGTKRVGVKLRADGRRTLRLRIVDAAGNRSRAAAKRLR